MSAAVELRTAADKLRELAEGATPGPWGWKPSIPVLATITERAETPDASPQDETLFGDDDE
jgi:hypothetical protein